MSVGLSSVHGVSKGSLLQGLIRLERSSLSLTQGSNMGE